MKTRSSVHNSERNLQDIKRQNQKLVDRLVAVKPVIRADDRPEKYQHIKLNPKKKILQSRKYRESFLTLLMLLTPLLCHNIE